VKAVNEVRDARIIQRHSYLAQRPDCLNAKFYIHVREHTAAATTAGVITAAATTVAATTTGVTTAGATTVADTAATTTAGATTAAATTVGDMAAATTAINAGNASLWSCDPNAILLKS
jgi:hypothetical protein